MSLLKSVLLFPAKTLEQGFGFLTSKSAVYSLPIFIEEFLDTYLNFGKREIFSREVSCIFLEYDEVWIDPTQAITQINEEIKLHRCVVVFGPYSILREIHKAMEDSYFHIPEKEDKEYTIQFLTDSNGKKQLPLVRPTVSIEEVCFQ